MFFTNKNKIDKLVNLNYSLETRRKPSWLNVIDIEKYNNSKSSSSFGNFSVIPYVTKEEQERMYDIYFKLRDADRAYNEHFLEFSTFGSDFMPVYNSKKKRLFGVIIRELPSDNATEFASTIDELIQNFITATMLIRYIGLEDFRIWRYDLVSRSMRKNIESILNMHSIESGAYLEDFSLSNLFETFSNAIGRFNRAISGTDLIFSLMKDSWVKDAFINSWNHHKELNLDFMDKETALVEIEQYLLEFLEDGRQYFFYGEIDLEIFLLNEKNYKVTLEQEKYYKYEEIHPKDVQYNYYLKFKEDISENEKIELLEEITMLPYIDIKANGKFRVFVEHNTRKIFGFTGLAKTSNSIYNSEIMEYTNSLLRSLLSLKENHIDLRNIDISDFVIFKGAYGDDFLVKYSDNSDNLKRIEFGNSSHSITHEEYVEIANQEIIRIIFSYISNASEVLGKDYIKCFPPKLGKAYKVWNSNHDIKIKPKRAMELVEYLEKVLYAENYDPNGEYYYQYVENPLIYKSLFSEEEVGNFKNCYYVKASQEKIKNFLENRELRSDLNFGKIVGIEYREKNSYNFFPRKIIIKNPGKSLTKINLDNFNALKSGSYESIMFYLNLLRIGRLKENDTFYNFGSYEFYYKNDEIFCYEAPKKNKQEKEITIPKLIKEVKSKIDLESINMLNNTITDPTLIEVVQGVLDSSKAHQYTSQFYNFFVKGANYCKVHKVEFPGSLKKCPICFKDVLEISGDVGDITNVQSQIDNCFNDTKVGFYIFDAKFSHPEIEDAVKFVKEISRYNRNVVKFLKILVDENDNCFGFVYDASDVKTENLKSLNNKELLEMIYFFSLWANNVIRETLSIQSNQKLQEMIKVFSSENSTKKRVTSNYLLNWNKISSIEEDFVVSQSNKPLLKNLLAYENNLGNQNFRVKVGKLIDDFLEKYDLLSILDGSDKDRFKSSLKTDGIYAVSVINNLDYYCEIHNHYTLKEKCEYCDRDFSDIDIVEYDISNAEPINKGGESNIYKYGTNRIAKIWKKDKIKLNQKVQVIKKLMNSQIKFKPYPNKELFIIRPIAFIKVKNDDDFQIGGYIMQTVKKAKPIRLLEDKNVAEKLGLDTTNILEMLVCVGKALEYIHSINAYIGDLSGNNIQFDSNGKVYILDVDSFGIDEIKSKIYTPGYADPMALDFEGNINTSKFSDYYSYAIISFLALTHIHPFKGVYLKDGNVVKMTTEKRMQNKISVLGNHNIRLPKHINENAAWGWMSDELKTAFLEIFEGEKRFNMVNILEEEVSKIREFKN